MIIKKKQEKRNALVDAEVDDGIDDGVRTELAVVVKRYVSNGLPYSKSAIFTNLAILSRLRRSPVTDLHLDAVPGLPTKRVAPEQLDLCWNKRLGAAHRCQILQTPSGAYEALTGELVGLAHRC